jgi:hypothetical protein
MLIPRGDLPRAVAAVKYGAVLFVDRRLTEAERATVQSITDGYHFRVVLVREVKGGNRVR